MTVNKWRGDAAIDDFDRYNAAMQLGFDDISYAGDPRRFFEVIVCFLSDCLSEQFTECFSHVVVVVVVVVGDCSCADFINF